jgi:hypothetical protein
VVRKGPCLVANIYVTNNYKIITNNIAIITNDILLIDNNSVRFRKKKK